MARLLAPYRTYVIRCWQEPCSQPNAAIYRFSLEFPGTGERFGFTCSEDLIQALQLALTEIQIQAIAESALKDES